MKSKNLIFFVVLFAICGGIFFGGGQLGVARGTLLIIIAAVFVLGIIVWLVLMLLSMRRAAKIEKGMKDQQSGPGASAGGGGQAEMYEQFNKYLAALKTSPTGKSALSELPWYLVIGAPGSGKTTALQESGLAFSSMGHGLRSVRGVGGTRNCDWWFADNAILLDTAGRYTTQPEDHAEWLAFLDLVRESRGRRALNGIIVTVSVGDLIKGDPSAIAAVVRPIRERILEVSKQLKLVLPVYVVFSKADLIGGFKDFFAGFSRSQRDQVWGVTIPAGERRQARDVFAERVGVLMGSLSARRTVAVSSGTRSPAQIAKLTLMPGNFGALQKWFGEFVGELFAPMPLADQPMFRGFYFTSGIQVPRPGEKAGDSASPTPSRPMPTQEQVDAARAKDMSVFFLPGADAAPAATEAADSRRGLFLKDLFARVIIPDRHLAGIPAALLHRARLLRLLVVFGSLALGLILGAMLTGRHIRDQQLINRAVVAGQALAADPAGKGAGEAVGAVENARSVMADAVVHGGGTGRAVIERLDPLYGSRIARSFIAPAASKIAGELDDLRRSDAKDSATYDKIFDLFRAYQMLGGAIPPDRVLLDRILIDEGRWFAAAGGKASDEDIRAAKAHLALIEAAGTKAKGWQARIEPQLVARVENALSGGALWIQQSFADTVSSLQSGAPIGRDRVVSGPMRDLIEIDAGVPTLFTPDGWDGTWQPTMDEKAAALRTRYAGIRIERTVDDIRGQLRKMYGREYNARWLRLVGSMRPAAFADLAQASTRLRQFAGEDSPYRSMVKNLGEFSRIEFGDPDVRVLLPTDPGWVDEGLKVMVELQAQIDRFMQGTQAGSRGKDAAKLGEFCSAADRAKAGFEAAAGKLENEAARNAAASCLNNILDAVHRALANDLGSEVDRAWAAEVARPFAEQLAGKFPFDLKSAVDAALPAVAKLYNPKSGALWARVAVIENLRQTRFAGKELLPTSLEYQRLIDPAKRFRDAFFAGGSEEPAVSFTLTLVQRAGVKDMSVAIGKQTFGLYDRPNRRYRYEWKNVDGGGSKVSLNLATGQWITKEQAAPGWGILRLLREAGAVARPEGGLTLTWTFIHQGKEIPGSAVLEEIALEPLVTGDALGSLVPPTKVSP